MPTADENVCCRMYPKIRLLMPADVTCICETAMFRDNCLNRNVLETCRWEYVDVHGPFGDEETPNELVILSTFIWLMQF